MKAVTNAYMDEVVYAERESKLTHLADVERLYTDASAKLNRQKENFKTDAEKIGIVIGVNDHDYLTRLQTAGCDQAMRQEDQ